MKRNYRYAIALVYFLTLLCSFGKANLLVNGGFEVPVLGSGAFITVAPGEEPAGFGWTVTSGTIDVGNLPNPFIHFAAIDGRNGLDLNGLSRGTIAQTFPTIVGQLYRLSFIYADNSIEGGISSASVTVMDKGTNTPLLENSVAHSNSTNGPPPAANADTFADLFRAIGPQTRLVLASTSPSNSASGGVLIDSVDIAAWSNTCDLNLDGSVDAADAGIMFASWGPATLALADKNLDGFVDAADAGEMFAEWTGDAAAVAVPEPSSAMLGGCLLSLILVARHRSVPSLMKPSPRY